MYKFDTNVMRAIRLTGLGKTHLAYLDHTGWPAARTLCNRKSYTPNGHTLNTVDVLGATMTPPCKSCLSLALTDSPTAIKALDD